MSFKTTLAADLLKIFNADEYARSGIYFFDDSSQKTIKMVLSQRADLSGYASGQARIADVFIFKSDVNHPKAGEEILDLETNTRWKVDQEISEADGVYKLFLSSDQRSSTNG